MYLFRRGLYALTAALLCISAASAQSAPNETGPAAQPPDDTKNASDVRNTPEKKAAATPQQSPLPNDDGDIWGPGTGPQAKPNRKYAFIELGIVLGGGIINYQRDQSNKKDQVFDTEEALKNRFNGFDSWRYDTNQFEVNNVSHPGAGALYYLTGRMNGYERFESYLFAIGSSTFWEYFCEIQEVVSINDMITTPFSGAAIGEAGYQLIRHIGKNDNFVISEPNRTSPYASRLPLSIGAGYNGRRQYMTIGTDYEAINSDAVSPSSSFAGFVNATMTSRIKLNAGFSNDYMEYAYFHANNTLFGFASIRNIYADSFSSGVASGLNTGFTYEMHHYSSFMDKIASVHLIGPSYETHIRKGDFFFLADGAYYFDFGGINSYALSKFLNAGHTKRDVETYGAYVTSIHGYYFAYGSTLMLRAAAGYGKTSAVVEMIYLNYNSINTDKRTNREKPSGNNFVMSDMRHKIRATLSRQLFDDLAISASYEYRRIWGSAADYSKSGKDAAGEIALAYTGI